MKARQLAMLATLTLLSTMDTGCISLFAETPQGLKVGLALGRQNNGPQQPRQPQQPQGPQGPQAPRGPQAPQTPGTPQQPNPQTPGRV